ncbi:TRAP-type mannitol/chloroaromatic compound transport system, small permease component [Tranquillimonas rosea]|uniref:TRAP transporter small permease protein n=1 Tax=Tranquillimonas rosea TaxID=641238 RepID=A0A1H9S535_9RHOB|nr:TRAP transporter small permease subunit [Tranquillimonas rosea]SER80166.1 TRAP-type mannitol/chloroaromatic compound transport system, small permease component [Tranquillimonas rosea]
MDRAADWLDRVNRITGATVRWIALVMVILQFGVVLLRYVFGISDIALNESVLYLHATLFMLGAGYTLLVDGHVRVDIFYAKARRGTRAGIDVFGHLVLLIPAMLALLYWSWPSVRNAWAIREGPISVGGIPAVYLLKTLIPAFCVLLIVQSVACLLRELARLRAGRE